MKVTLAATQMKCTWEINDNISKAKDLINTAAKKGANIILIQELFQTPYFCIEYDEKIFNLAKPFKDNPVIKEMADLAKKLNVVLPISYFEVENNASCSIHDNNYCSSQFLHHYLYRKKPLTCHPQTDQKYES